MAVELLAAVEAALGRNLGEAELRRVEHLAVGARALVRGHLRQDPPADAAQTITYVEAQMIIRALDRAAANDTGVSSQTFHSGPYQTTQSFSTDSQGGGVWLTRQDQIMLAPWRITMASVPLVSERS